MRKHTPLKIETTKLSNQRTRSKNPTLVPYEIHHDTATFETHPDLPFPPVVVQVYVCRHGKSTTGSDGLVALFYTVDTEPRRSYPVYRIGNDTYNRGVMPYRHLSLAMLEALFEDCVVPRLVKDIVRDRWFEQHVLKKVKPNHKLKVPSPNE